jgi:hypothetical protein
MRSMILPGIGAALVLLTSIVVQAHQSVGFHAPTMAQAGAAPTLAIPDGARLPPPYAMRLSVW